MEKEVRILAGLREQGHRITLARKCIIRCLLEVASPISSLDLHRKLSQIKIDMNKTTVYRELEFLKEAGVVQQLQFGDRSRLYEIVPDDHRHHLVCKSCHAIEGVVLENDLDEVERRLKKQTKFRVEDHTLAFFGTCQKCQ